MFGELGNFIDCILEGGRKERLCGRNCIFGFKERLCSGNGNGLSCNKDGEIFNTLFEVNVCIFNGETGLEIAEDGANEDIELDNIGHIFGTDDKPLLLAINGFVTYAEEDFVGSEFIQISGNLGATEIDGNKELE